MSQTPASLTSAATWRSRASCRRRALTLLGRQGREIEVEASELYVRYEDAALLETCNQIFARNQEFVLDCNDASLGKCRRAADLFLRYESQRPRKGWENLKMLARLGVAGMRVPPIMAVCNKALLLGWTVVVQSEKNQVLRLTGC
jgi:hypothetical protein